MSRYSKNGLEGIFILPNPLQSLSILSNPFRELGILLPLITTNFAILGLALFSTNKGYGLVEGLIYALGAGGGVTLALVLMAGLLSMAFMGFAGMFAAG